MFTRFVDWLRFRASVSTWPEYIPDWLYPYIVSPVMCFAFNSPIEFKAPATEEEQRALTDKVAREIAAETGYFFDDENGIIYISQDVYEYMTQQHTIN